MSNFIDNIDLLCQMEGKKLTPTISQMGISPGSLSRWRKGSTINSDLILKIAKYFGVSTDFILTGKDSIAKRQIYKQAPLASNSSTNVDAEFKAMVQRYNALPENLKAQCRTFILAMYSASQEAAKDQDIDKDDKETDIVITPSYKTKGGSIAG